MNIQRLRNLTTGRLHTTMDDIQEDMEYLIGEQGLMTHMLPNVSRAMEPWLKEKTSKGDVGARLWDDKYDPNHIGEYPIDPMDETERAAFFKRYSALPSPFAKTV